MHFSTQYSKKKWMEWNGTKPLTAFRIFYVVCYFECRTNIAGPFVCKCTTQFIQHKRKIKLATQKWRGVQMTAPSKILTKGSQWIKTTSSSGNSKLEAVYEKQNIYIWKQQRQQPGWKLTQTSGWKCATLGGNVVFMHQIIMGW